MNANDVLLIARAVHYAAHAHRRQTRKGEEATPYVNHLAEVAHLLAEAGCPAEVVAAGYLHDTIEDVGVTYEMLHEEFGAAIAGLVLAVTDDKALPKQVRKDLQVEHAAHSSPQQAALKLADKISNLRSLRSNPPAGWDRQRIVEYAAWAHRVVSNLPSPNPFLLERYASIRLSLLASLEVV